MPDFYLIQEDDGPMVVVDQTPAPTTTVVQGDQVTINGGVTGPRGPRLGVTVAEVPPADDQSGAEGDLWVEIETV